MSEQTGRTPEPQKQFTELLQALEDASFWPDDSDEVQLIETHISWVFLTRRFAFKLKKPLKFDFLDFSSLATRQAACEDEVRLNRRLAPDVYLGVRPITRESSGKLKLAGEGEVVDYLVHMRRLSEVDRLDLRMQKNQIHPKDLEPLIGMLTHFYQQAPPLNLQSETYLATMESHVRDNRKALLQHEILEGVVRRVCAAQLKLLKFQPELFLNRVKAGHVIEGHGDLRPEHIYLGEKPVIMDCIEFNADFRQLDIADELCFLAMECDAMQQSVWGEQVLAQCLANLQDHPPQKLLAFYKSYRATVRAKVAALRAQQQQGKDRAAALQLAWTDLQLAENYLTDRMQPTLFVVGGLMGAGKSTLASRLAKSLGLEHLQTDIVRKEVLGKADAGASFGEGKYSRANRERVYESLLEQAEQRLASGMSVVIDGTFSKLLQRARTADLAKQQNARRTLLWCHCPVEIAEQRIAARLKEGKDASEARPELLTQQLAAAEIPTAAEAALRVDTTLPQEEQLDKLFSELAKEEEN